MAVKNKHKKTVSPPETTSWLVPVVRILIALAMGISAYLLYVSLTTGSAAGCGPDSGCDRVLKSRWAYLFGIPVSAPALVTYGAFLFFSRGLNRKAPLEVQRKAWPFLMAIAVMILSVAAWFILLQLVVIKSICPFCMVAHTAGSIASLLVLFNLPMQPALGKAKTKEPQVGLTKSLASKCAFAGFAAVLGMVFGQMVYQKATHVVVNLNMPKQAGTGQVNQATTPVSPQQETSSRDPASNTAEAAQAQSKTNPTATSSGTASIQTTTIAATKPLSPPAQSRWTSTHGGFFTYDVANLPGMGSPDAKDVIVSLFDYTCHHCQIMHGHLLEALKVFGNDLAVVSLPMPLDAECNPLVWRTHRTALNACQYARLGLAVWRADRSKFHQFDDWMFAQQRPPPLTEASNYAVNLVGANPLNTALMDSWINERIKQNISIYNTNMILLTNGSMPQLIIGSKISVGSMRNAEDLIKVLKEGLAP